MRVEFMELLVEEALSANPNWGECGSGTLL